MEPVASPTISPAPSSSVSDSESETTVETRPGVKAPRLRLHDEDMDTPKGHRDGLGDTSRRLGQIIVVMGVSGSGKSTLGKALAERMGLPFVDGDDLQPPANVAKMSRGEPLDDADRQPWLERIRRTAMEYAAVAGGVVVACSALKLAYRAVLRGEGGGPETSFVYMKGERKVLMDRMLHREGHYMKAGMLDSQLATLESPEDEAGVVTLSVEMSTEEQICYVSLVPRSE